MASHPVDLAVEQAESGSAGALLAACVVGEGSAAHAWFAAGKTHAARDIADAIHFLCVLHGRHPGVIELAALRATEPAARAWLSDAADAMADERKLLAKLAVAAGGAPSTPGSAQSEAAVASQRGALATLAQSDRHGCALGAALAFALDWRPVRTVLEGAAAKLGVEVPHFRLGQPDEIRLVADVIGENPLAERALLFGASQLARQHWELWSLLETRAQARIAAER
jgi:hypothetical protein